MDRVSFKGLPEKIACLVTVYRGLQWVLNPCQERRELMPWFVAGRDTEG
jgi:hypothetical protein